MTNRIALTLVFTLSFLSYMTAELSTSVQLAPLALFAVLVFFKVLFSKSILDAVGSLFQPDGLLYVLFISLLTIATSLASGSEKSFEFALIISGCLIFARLYMAVVPIREVLEAFFWSGILSVAIFVPMSLAVFTQSIETLARFSAFSFHPNLLAFVLAGYFCVMVWKFVTGDWRMKILAGVAGFLCLVIIFFASSRGSIVGILGGGFFVAGITIAGRRGQQRKGVLRTRLLAAAVMLGLFLYVQNLEWTHKTYAFVDQVLQLSQQYRGIDSGFSGRFDKWVATVNGLSDGNWILGKGIRSSDSMQDNLIDNGYLVILYEIGLIPAALITWRFLSVSRRILSGYFHSTKEERNTWFACGLLMTVFLVNNIVARFLFSVGNPYSLLAFFLFVTPIERIGTSLRPSVSDRKLSGLLVNRSASSLQPSS
jgi:hypothetical protein